MHVSCTGPQLILESLSVLSSLFIATFLQTMCYKVLEIHQIPGWSGLSNARVTIFGDVYPLPENQQVTTQLMLLN